MSRKPFMALLGFGSILVLAGCIPEANFAASPTEGNAPLTVLFMDSSVAGIASIDRVEWVFSDPTSGDQNRSNEPNPQHTFQEAGEYEVFLTVFSAFGASRTSQLIIVHTGNEEPPSNNAPIIETIPAYTCQEDEVFSFEFSCSDPDGDALTLSGDGLPEGATLALEQNKGVFTWSPGYDAAGEYAFDIILHDDGEPSLTATASVEVTVTNVNRAPQLESIAEQQVLPGSNLSFVLSASDPDNDDITFSGEGLPSGANLNAGTGAFSWTPASSDAGKYTVTFMATDKGVPALSTSMDVSIEVLASVESQPLANFDFPADSGDEQYYASPSRGNYGLNTDPGDNDIPCSATQSDGAVQLSAQRTAHGWSSAYLWMSVAGHSDDLSRTLEPTAPLPWPINAAGQPTIKGIRVKVKGSGDFTIQLIKRSSLEPVDENPDAQTVIAQHHFAWFESDEYVEHEWLFSEEDAVEPFKLMTLVVDGAVGSPQLVVDEIGLLLEPKPGLTYYARTWLASAAQVFSCLDRESGYVREFSDFPINDMDNTAGMGLTSLVCAQGVELGFIDRADALEILNKTKENLLSLPNVDGILPHWSSANELGEIVAHAAHDGFAGTEYSSIDTALALLPQLIAAKMLNASEVRTALLAFIRDIDFEAIATVDNFIGHGYSYEQEKLSSCWRLADGESALVNVLVKLSDPNSQYGFNRQLADDDLDEDLVFQGRGFLAEIAALFYGEFGGEDLGADSFGLDWFDRRCKLLDKQRLCIGGPNFLAGYSAMEIASAQGNHAYLVNGLSGYDRSVFTPEAENDQTFGDEYNWGGVHYAIMSLSTRPEEADAVLHEMFEKGVCWPLTGPAESVLFAEDGATIERIHYRQSILNAAFCSIALYNLITVVQDAPNAVYEATRSDSALSAAVNAARTQERGQSPVAFPAEDAERSSAAISVMPRSNAEGKKTVLLPKNQYLGFEFTLGRASQCAFEIRFSNDHHPSYPFEVITLELVGNGGAGERQTLGSFTSEGTNQATQGAGWNVFKTGTISVDNIESGAYKLELHAGPEGDPYSIEIDQVILKLSNSK